MDVVAPSGGVYQAGTLSGNPVAMAAGIAQLTLLKERPEYYGALNQKAGRFFGRIQEIVADAGLPYQVNHVGSLGCLFFADGAVTDYPSAKSSNTKAFAAYCNDMIAHGVYLAPSQFEAMFLSIAHTDEILDAVLEIIGNYFTG